MNPVRLWAVFELRSYGVNVPDSLQGQCPKATGVNPWYGVYILRFAMESGLISQILEIASMPFHACTYMFIFLRFWKLPACPSQS
jgi:hypothetical protein